MSKLILVILVATVALDASPALAEVMDKEPSSSLIWAVAIVCSLLGAIAARFKPYVSIVTGLTGGLYLGGVVAEIQEAPIGKAIIQEAGQSYLTQLYAAIGVVVLSHVVGFLLRGMGQPK